MAKRPVFTTSNTPPYFIEIETEFTYAPGFSIVQKQKSIESLHEQFLKKHNNKKILEISSKSKNELGVKLSAFNLMVKISNNKEYSVEVAFQASKVFEHGGPFKDLLNKTSREAKKDPRLKSSGRLQYFHWGERKFELSPTTFFYNWLYINTLSLHPELSSQLINYDAFTDIEFNPDKSLNCQARAAALYVSLYKNGLLDSVLKDRDKFLDIVYVTNIKKNNTHQQLTLWD